MELDDLKGLWQEHDRKLAASLRLNTRVVRDALMGKTESALRRHRRSIAIELVIHAIALLLLGGFIAEHVREVRFVVPAAALHLSVVLHVAAAIRQWIAMAEIDYGAPVVEIQKKAATVRAESVRVTKWTLWAAPLLWTPLVIVLLQGILGWDAYVMPGSAWLVANLVFGVAFLLLMIRIAKRFAGRMSSPRLQWLIDELSGRHLTAAKNHLEEAARFERD